MMIIEECLNELVQYTSTRSTQSSVFENISNASTYYSIKICVLSPISKKNEKHGLTNAQKSLLSLFYCEKSSKRALITKFH